MSWDLNSDFTSKVCLFGVVKLAKNANLDQYICSGYGIGLDSRSELSLPDGSMSKDFFIFGVDMSSSMHIDIKKN